MTVTHLHHLRADDDGGIKEFRDAIEASGLPLTKVEANAEVHACVIERGMASGRPSVMFWWVTDMGVIAAEMSLDQLIMTQIGMEGMAEVHFGFKRR